MTNLVRFEKNGKTYLSPGPRSFSEVEIIPALDDAKQEANRQSSVEHIHCYVVPVDGGYVVMGYADHWTYFHKAPGDNVVYKIEV